MLWQLSRLAWVLDYPYRGYHSGFWYGYPTSNTAHGHLFRAFQLDQICFLELRLGFVLGGVNGANE
jgi:hypothetical protein